MRMKTKEEIDGHGRNEERTILEARGMSLGCTGNEVAGAKAERNGGMDVAGRERAGAHRI